MPPEGRLAIVGPTAAGKSALAMALARRDPSIELVTADSMQVYRGMDIGTAKPTPADRAEVRHHLLDLVDPGDDFDVATFQAAARRSIADIESRGHRPVLVGGTALYVRAVVDDLDLPGRYPSVRAELDVVDDTEALHARLAGLDPVAASRMVPSNRRRVVRALEVTLGSGRPFSSYGPGLDHHGPTSWLLIGLDRALPDLDARIHARYQAMLDAGLLDEVRRCIAAGWSRTASQALGYKELADHLAGHCDLATAVETAERRTRRFARRQLKWFRRDPRVRWFDAAASDLVDRVIASGQDGS